MISLLLFFITSLMSLLISGSVAYDTILSTLGNFTDQIFPESLDSFSLSLFAPTIRREYGGTAGNIAYNLALLGKHPDIIASVGEEAGEYIDRLSTLGIGTHSIHRIPQTFTANAYIINDESSRQITAFSPGAMMASGELSLARYDYTHAIVAPDAMAGVLARVTECVERGIFTIFDPGQNLGIMPVEMLIDLVSRSQMTIMNDSERELFLSRTGVDFVTLCLEGGSMAIVTLGERGVEIHQRGESIHIDAITPTEIVDPTGCGDAFRAGLLYGLSEDWTIERSARLGAILGGLKIAHRGGQNHTFTHHDLDALSREQYGIAIFTE